VRLGPGDDDGDLALRGTYHKAHTPVRLRFAIRIIDAKLVGVLLSELLAGAAVFTLFAAEMCLFIALPFVPGNFALVFFGITGGCAVIAFFLTVYNSLWSDIDEPCDEPVRDPLSNWPELEGVVRELARDLRRPAPSTGFFLLSPTLWRRFGCLPARKRRAGDVVIPVGLLQIWSVLSLRCHIAHEMARRAIPL